jgi:hypothetical protein
MLHQHHLNQASSSFVGGATSATPVASLMNSEMVPSMNGGVGILGISTSRVNPQYYFQGMMGGTSV